MKHWWIPITIGLGVILTVGLIFISQWESPVRVVEEPVVEEESIMKTIQLGGEWFINNQGDEFLFYEFNPYTGEHSDDHHSLREIGALWAITVLHEFFEDERYEDLAKKGFSYFENTLKHDDSGEYAYINITPTEIKLGYNGLLLLSLLGIDHPEKGELIEQLTNGILAQQDETGEFKTFFFSDRATGVDYYPGEAMLALMGAYEVTRNPEYVEAVERALPFYRSYWRGNKNTALISWQSQAYERLYAMTGNKEAAAFVLEMNDYMLEQHGGGCENFSFSRGITTAVFIEGVISGYEVAVAEGDEAHAQCYAQFVREGLDHVVDLQLTFEDKIHLAGVGGFVGSEDSVTQRVDRNQHAVMALIRAYDLGLVE